MPSISHSVVATLAGSPAEIVGARFGTRSAASALIVREGSRGEHRIASSDPSIVSWSDAGITFQTPSDAISGTVAVETSAGRSRAAAFDVYQYDSFPVPESPGANASPLALAIDGSGRVWLSQEFHVDSAPLAVLQPPASSLTLIEAPAPPGPGPFATRIGGADKRTQFSELGEDVLVDSKGRVWFTEGGGLLYDGPLPNHSRVVCYDPAAPPAGRLRIYNLPGDHNEVVGLAWDAARGRMWLAQAGLMAGPKLLSFDPEQTLFDNSFDFSRPLDSLLHSVHDADQSGYRVYPLPAAAAYPAHLLVQPDGSVWFTAYIGNAIGRLDPATRAGCATTSAPARQHQSGGPRFWHWRAMGHRTGARWSSGDKFPVRQHAVATGCEQCAQPGTLHAAGSFRPKPLSQDHCGAGRSHARADSLDRV